MYKTTLITRVFLTMNNSSKPTYYVERIVGRRKRKRNYEYFVKWVDWPHEQNTWEPIEHLSECLDMIEEYNRQVQLSKDASHKPNVELKKDPKSDGKSNGELKKRNTKKSNVDSEQRILTDSSNQKEMRCTSNGQETSENSAKRVPNGFERGWVADEIVGATDSGGVLKFLIKWKGKDDDTEELVPAKIARHIVPQMVIEFYEKHTRWEEDANQNEK